MGEVGESFEGLKLYRDGEARWDHQAEIPARYGFREFSDSGVQLGLIRWLYARCWVTAERPSVLFDLATARMVEARVLLPGASVLARLVARAGSEWRPGCGPGWPGWSMVSTVNAWNGSLWYPMALGRRERLSPLRHDHINLHGRYYFTPSDAITRGELRNLRDAANPQLAAGIPPAP